MTAESFQQWRSRQSKLSNKTLNEYLSHATALLNWMVRQGRATTNPLKAVHKLARKDTFTRRALTPEEFNRLVEGSKKRGLRYLFAGCTGLRRGEIKQVLWTDLHLEDPLPYIDVRAEITKSKRSAVLPLIPLLADALRKERQKRGPRITHVFPRGLPSVKTLTKDLVACGIPVQDSRGYRVDFHALRHTFASLLAGASVSELARVKLARHSEWKMTDRYTDPRAIPLFSEMDKVAPLLPSQTVSQISKPTGQNASKSDQTAGANRGAEIIDFQREIPAFANAEPEAHASSRRGGTTQGILRRSARHVSSSSSLPCHAKLRRSEVM